MSHRGVMSSVTASDSRPSGNVSDLLRTAAASFPDRPALIWAGGSRNWAQLDRAVDTGAIALGKAGLAVGDRVIVSLQTGADLIVALFAVARAGMVAVPVGPSRAGLDVIVAKVTAAGSIAGQPGIPVQVSLGPDVVADWWGGETVSVESSAGGEDIAVLARVASGDRPVMVSHRAILAAVAAIVAAPSLRLRSDDRAILILPTYHLAGWVTAFLPLCAVGAAAVIPNPQTAGVSWVEAVLSTVRSQRVTVVPGAPGLYRRLRTASGVERALSSVRLMTSGAAPLDPGDFSALRTLTGQAVWEGYGISESASAVSTSLMTAAARTGSVGLPLAGLRLRIVGDDGVDLYAAPGQDVSSAPADTGSDDPAADAADGGEVGRIQISGPTLFSGYWPDGSGGVDDEGWFATGDLGYLDDIGELHLVDRAAETIRIAGFTVYPREVEDLLATHPYVRDAAVIGVPGRAGQQVVAVLVPLWGTRPTPPDLDEFVAARLPAFKRPQRYQLVDRLPRNEIGRIDRDAVRAMYRPDESLDASPAVAESAELAGRVLADTGPERAARRDPAEPAKEVATSAEVAPVAEVAPEPAAPLEELGSRLPGTGERDRRGDDDTDEDLF